MKPSLSCCGTPGFTKSSPAAPGFDPPCVRSGGRGCLRPAAAAVLLALLALAHSPSPAQEGRGYLAVDGGYKTGDFGTAIRSNLYHLSPTLGYVAPRYDVSLTAPFLFLSAETGGISETETGIGDVVVRGGRVLVPEGSSGFSFDALLAVKLPTADETRGLGTGEADVGAFAGLHQRAGAFKVSLLGGYIKAGDPPGVDFNDVILYGIGASRMFGKTDVFASFEGRRSMISGSENPRELNAGFFHALTRDIAVRGSTFFGLNDGGPDFGFSLGIVYWI